MPSNCCPLLESDGDLQWGYGTSLFFCMQTSQGGANQLKHFIRACHQRGIAVILDVVYNHFATSGDNRSEWGYDSDPNVAPQHNTWNWYQGLPTDYPGNINGGYLDNFSTRIHPALERRKCAPDVHQQRGGALRRLPHRRNSRGPHRCHPPEQCATCERIAGRHRQPVWRQVSEGACPNGKLVKPSAFLIAEDYTGWSAMTQPVNQGGEGFDAVWYMDFYHHLIGDGNYGDGYANLLKNAGYGVPGPLNMDFFAGALLATQYDKVAYHESHDEAGNDRGTERTIVTAVERRAAVGATRTYAEGRCRFCFGMAAFPLRRSCSLWAKRLERRILS